MTIDDALREASGDASRGEVSFPHDLHGFPGTVHGGAVAALFYRLALPEPPVHLRMDLRREVPTGTALRLGTGRVGVDARLALDHGGRRLAEATLSRSEVPRIDPGPVTGAWTSRQGSPEEIPGTATCLACGSANPLGLRVRFLFNDRLLWSEYTPPASYRTGEGSIHPALAMIMLDELGWWLGALAQGECGVTSELTITVVRHPPFGPLLALVDRAAVRPVGDSRGRYCHASGYLFSAKGGLVAAGAVRFAGSRAYTRRLLEPFLETTDAATVTRLFPRAGSFGRRAGR